jgi:hypothetical protein
MQRIDDSKAHSRMIAERHMTSKHLRAKSKGRAKIAGLALAAGSLLSMSGFGLSGVTGICRGELGSLGRLLDHIWPMR